jgi:2-desacetyl-2-hydroxyethyl bacteriochlorophyllide A dehydrogenase
VRAVRGVGERAVTVVDVDVPGGPGELLTMRSASICGSDFNYLAGGSRFVMGHELAGLRDDGTAVAVEPMFSCGVCEVCVRGDYNLCERIAVAGLGMMIDGGMSEYFRVPTERAVPLPHGLRVEDASLVEPTAVAWHSVGSGDVGPDTRVLVIGGGAIGLLSIAVAQAMGAPEVALVARHAHQVEIGQRLGATEAKGLYDVVVEAAGTPSSFAQCIDSVAPGGNVVLTGIQTQAVELPFIPMLLKEARLVPAIGYGRHSHGHDVGEAAALLARRPELVDSLITHRFPIEEAPRAFEVAADRAHGAIKVVVEINS